MYVRPRHFRAEIEAVAPVQGNGGGVDDDAVDAHRIGDHVHRCLAVNRGDGRTGGPDGDGPIRLRRVHGEIPRAADARAGGGGAGHRPGDGVGGALRRGGELLARALLHRGVTGVDRHAPHHMRRFVPGHLHVRDDLAAFAVYVGRRIAVDGDGGEIHRVEVPGAADDVEAEIVRRVRRQERVAAVQGREAGGVFILIQGVPVSNAETGPGGGAVCIAVNVPVLAARIVPAFGARDRPEEGVAHLPPREAGGGEGHARGVLDVQLRDVVPVGQSGGRQQAQSQQQRQPQGEEPFRSLHLRFLLPEYMNRYFCPIKNHSTADPKKQSQSTLPQRIAPVPSAELRGTAALRP